MAKSNTKKSGAKPVVTKQQKKEDVVEKNSERSVEDIEADLQLPESSDEEDEGEVIEQDEEDVSDLSEESEDEELQGFSSDDEAEEQEEADDEKEIKKIKKDGHSVIKTIIASDSGKSSKKAKKRGIIYIGRIPHGFYETEMKKYFEQFGNIINLKLSRNKKTGKSKHYGFIEFDNFEVAKIAAEAMNNYLIFGHLLKVEVVETANEELFKDSDKKFKVIPWNKISKHKNDKPKSKKQWGKLVEKYENQKLKKQAELKEKGIDFDLTSI
ncbi:uncharacterized protein RJT20DRAFT_130212 [Scheffersomyces xylosifermentans]|uniref:uncharacterized protein n=1 Tax=Scheffersomyces xylosifermentans TaxID=1304137 RepID=UPI00315DC9F1